MTNGSYGHFAAIDVSILNGSFLQRRHSNSQHQGLSTANNGPPATSLEYVIKSKTL